MENSQHPKAISLGAIFRRFRWRISFTWVLVAIEAILYVLFPLGMGLAIDGILGGRYGGLSALAAIAILSLLVGAGRRYYDTRVYANIYARISPELVAREKGNGKSVSVISARANLATEFVEFLESSFPDLVNSTIGLGGTLVLIAVLNMQVFLACLVVMVLITVVYTLTSQKTYDLNRNFNHELERQVTVLTADDTAKTVSHFRSIARWNIRLSDLETTTFSLSWLFLMGLLVYALFAIIDGGATSQGTVFAILMYVFNFIESVVGIPLYYQQFVRLREISHRLADDTGDSLESQDGKPAT